MSLAKFFPKIGRKRSYSRNRLQKRKMLCEALEGRRVLATVSVADVIVNEDSTASVVISAESITGSISVDWATSSGTATSGSDFTANSGTVNLDFSNPEATVNITLSDDSLKESGETFYVTLSNVSGATIADGTGVVTISDNDATGVTRAIDLFKGGGEILHSGASRFHHTTPSGLGLEYSSLTHAGAILDIRTVQPEDSSVPSEIKAELSVDGSSVRTIYYDTAGLSAGDDLRFAFEVDGTSLGSGTYEWRLDLTETVGSDESFRSFKGLVDIYDRSSSSIGAGWEISELDRLEVTTDWVTVLFANGSTAHYDRSEIGGSGGGGGPGGPGGPGGGGGGSAPEVGLKENGDGTFTYTTESLSTLDFDSSGKLTAVTDPNDNKTEYTYTSGLLSKITLQDGRDIDFSYSSGLLSTITDWAGRVTTLTHNGSDQLTKITSPDPDGAGSLAAPETDFTYWSGSDLLKQITDPLSNATDIAYDAFDRVSSITKPGSAVYNYSPQLVEGLVASGAGTSGSPADLPDADPSGSVTNPLSDTSYAKFAPLGVVIETTDALGNVSTWERNDAGYVTKFTAPDPDGAGSLTSPVTNFTYDTANNLTEIEHPDASKETWAYDSTWNKPTKYTDAEGGVTNYTLDSDGNVTEIVQVIGNVDDLINMETDDISVSMTYSSNPTAVGQMPGGLLLTTTDPNGVITDYDYGTNTSLTSFAQLTSITYADGTSDEATVSYTYDSDYLLSTFTDALGNDTDYAYDELGRLTETTFPDPDGAGSQTSPVTTTAYNALGLVTSVTNALSQVTSYTYDSRNRLSTVTTPDPDGAGGQAAAVTTYTYDAANNLTGIEDADGNDTTYAYDDAGRLTSITYPDPDDTGPLSSPVESFAYDNMGRRTSFTDALSQVTTYAYNSRSWLTTETLPDPDGAGSKTSPVWTYVYDDNGLLTTTTDPLGNDTVNTFDEAGRLTNVLFADPDDTGPLAAPDIDYAYDNASNLTSMTNASGDTTTYAYDNLNRKTSATMPDPDGLGPLAAPTLAWAYNDAGLLTSSTDEQSSVTTYAYDDLNRLTTLTLPDPDGAGSQSSPVYSYAYNSLGLINTTTDPLGNVTTNTYDDRNRLTEVEEPDPDGAGSLSSPTTTYVYDILSRMTSLTDATSNTTSWSYDNLGRKTGETNALSDSESFEYDAVGQLTSYTDREGREIEYSYDNLGQLTSEVWKNGSTTVRTLTFDFDAAGNLTQASDPAATYDYLFDDLHRTTQVAADFGSSVDEFRLSYSYDVQSRIDSLELATNSGSGWSDDLINEYTYNALNQLTSLNQSGQSGGATVQDKRVDFLYTVDGRFSKITRYDSLSGGGANEVAETVYDRDEMGRITSLEHLHDTTSIADYDFTYDAYSRITEIAGSSSTGLSGTTDFTYDTTGQLTDADHTHITDESYSYDESGNRTDTGYTTGTANRLTSDGTFNYTYDDNGNRITKSRISSASADDKTVEYEWDHRNRLTSVVYKNNSGTVTKEVTYEYDVFDRRLVKSVDADGAGAGSAVVERYVYDGDDILVVTDSSGSVEKRVLHGPDVDQVLAIEDDATSEVLWALTDHLGSVRDLVDDDGNVENHIVFDSYGNVVSETASSVDFLYGFTGRERDEETGQNYHRARYLDTDTGRWLSEDPIGFLAGDTNIQRYVGNDPVNSTDSTGLLDDGINESIGADATQLWNNNDRKKLLPESTIRCHEAADCGNWFEGDEGPAYRLLTEIIGERPDGRKRNPLGILLGPAAIFDGTIARDIGKEAERSREKIEERIHTTDDPFEAGAGEVARRIGIAGEVISYLALSEVQSAPLTMVPPIPRFPSKGLGNPFKNKTATQIDKMLKKKGFTTRGPDPAGGTGGYVNEKTTRSYHIDPKDWGKHREPNHVDVNRPKAYKGPLEKKKFPYKED